MRSLLEFGLLLSAFGQALLAVINLGLVRLLHWEKEVAAMSPLVRQVFHVHGWFISITLLIFAALSGRFAPQIAAGAEPVYCWLAAGIGLFWGIRAVMQVTYYSSSHWRGSPSRTFMHFFLLAVYGGWAALYLLAAFLSK